MTIKFRIKSKKDNANIYLVFSNGRDNPTLWKSIKFIKCNPKIWDNKRGQFKKSLIPEDDKRNIVSNSDRLTLNNSLLSLNHFISLGYSLDAAEGKTIDSEWLENKIYSFFKQEKKGNKHRIYLEDYIKNWWKINDGKIINKKTNRYISKKSNDVYRNAVSCILKFEEIKSKKTKFSNINKDWQTSWIDFLLKTKEYNYGTANLYHSKLLQFLKAADKIDKIRVNTYYESGEFIVPDTSDEDEVIDEIFLDIKKLDYLMTPEMDKKLTKFQRKSRDILVICCWTGIRYGNYKKLTESYTGGNFIDVMTTIKTKEKVTIPLFAAVQVIIQENGGKMPKAESRTNFNRKIKKVCKAAGFNDLVNVGVKNKGADNTQLNRKRTTETEFYNAVTGHIGRGSFATLMYHSKEVSEETIMAICGWKTLSQMKEYIKDKMRGKILDAVQFGKTEDVKYNERLQNNRNLKAV